MRQSQRMGVALIGAGMIAQTHVQALSAARPGLSLRAVVSRRPDRARPLAQHYDGPPPEFTADLGRVLADPDIAFAIIATPPSVREEVIEPLVAAGKHILLEKPVARTTEEAERVVQICDAAGVTLGLLFQHRARAPSIEAADLVAGGTLGRLGLIEIAVPLWRPQAYYDELGRGTYARDGGGVMLTNAIHSIDLALSLTAEVAGPVTTVQAMTATTPLHRMEAEDYAVAGLRFAGGAAGSLVASTATYPHGTEAVSLHFERASLRLTRDRLEVSWRDGPVGQTPQAREEAYETPMSGARFEWHQAVIEDFARAVRTGTPPMATGADGVAAHLLISAIERSQATGARVDMA